MASRRQSVRESDIVITEKDSRLPGAGTPNIQGVRYNPEPALRVEGEGNNTDPVQTTIPAPRNVSVKEQRIRFAPDGTQYVTVVIEFDEVAGAEYYETRISKR